MHARAYIRLYDGVGRVGPRSYRNVAERNEHAARRPKRLASAFSSPRNGSRVIDDRIA